MEPLLLAKVNSNESSLSGSAQLKSLMELWNRSAVVSAGMFSLASDSLCTCQLQGSCCDTVATTGTAYPSAGRLYPDRS